MANDHGRAMLETDLPGLQLRRGKVRDVYDLGDRLLLVASDRISAFDWVLPTGIPDKGRVLTGMSAFWFDRLGVEHHLIWTEIDEANLDLKPEVRDSLFGRSMIVKKLAVVPFECVVRGYLAGSGWKEYQRHGKVCEVDLPGGLVESSRIEPIFTPATKAELGHDENVGFEVMAKEIGHELAERIRDLSLKIYNQAAAHADSVGLILADTKFEFGTHPDHDDIILIDEVLTPDSSRYWPKDIYQPGGPQPSFDKQFVRDWLAHESGWDQRSQPPPLPADVVAKTRVKYLQAYQRLLDRPFPWI